VIHSGSYARSENVIGIPDDGTMVCWASVEIWMFPTHVVVPPVEGEDVSGGGVGTSASNQCCVWSWGDLGLYMNPNNGCLVLCYKGEHHIISSIEPHLNRNAPLLPKKWYHVTVIIRNNPTTAVEAVSNRSNKNSNNNWYCELTIMQQDGISKRKSQLLSVSEKVCIKTNKENDGNIDKLSGGSPMMMTMMPINAHFELATGGTFNGKLENPKITTRDETYEVGMEDHLLISWDTSKNMTEWSIPSNNHDSSSSTSIQKEDNPLLLYNHPTRAVRGHSWDGTEFNWKHQPGHYGGIHFHDDDVYDFGWECDFEWVIPSGIPSGIYIMRLTKEQGEDEESLPLFICPPLVQFPSGEIDCEMKKKVCILVSTFTYVMYGNHARADFQPSWKGRMRDWNAYPHNPSQYPNYGCSTYNFHNDNSGICFASHLRPLFNLRPKYLTFGDSTCSGLRHFPADTHLIAWMHHNNIDYDIITDHELHKDGVAAIAGYQTLMTGTHPEYHTHQTLNALQEFRDGYGGNLIYLGGNGFYWRVAAKDEDASILEIRRAEDGVRTWASNPGEYHHMLDGGNYGGLWRRNDRPPQRLVGVGFTAQGSFVGMPYRRICFSPDMEWLFKGVEKNDVLLGDFGFSGNGAAGFELDCVDRQLDGGEHVIVMLAQSFDEDNRFMLVPEEVLTTYSNLSGVSSDQARRSDMVYFRTASGAQVFSVGSITFCGSLPWNHFENNISTILHNVIQHFSSR